MMILIDNYDSFTYNLYQSLALLTSAVKVIRNDHLSVAEVLALKPSGIILSPGPGRPENAGICVDLIRALPAQLPLLGVCLGHQAIALAFGGKVISAGEICHGKADLVFHHRQDLYQHLPLPFQAGRYHSLMVERTSLPQDLVIDAESAEGRIMGMRHASRPIYGVQFHPESILTPQGDRLLENFVRKCGS